MAIQLGKAANLVAGLESSWNPASGCLDILCSPNGVPIRPKPIAEIVDRGRWTFYPTITLHDTALGLLDELIPYRVVNPASFADAPKIGAGALLAGTPGAEAALSALSKTVGVTLGDPTYGGYALVKITRTDGVAEHASSSGGVLIHARARAAEPDYGLSEEFERDTVRLRHAGLREQQDYGTSLDKDKAAEFLNSFSEFGTHYVSSVTLGDTILQVFAYLPNQWQKIRDIYKNPEKPLSGPGAQDFIEFTTPRPGNAYGYVEQYGQLLCLSHSVAFRQSCTQGKWHEKLWSNRDSIFALYGGSGITNADLRRDFRDQVPAVVNLASLCVMIEHKRALLWRRLFKGAMLQKYRLTIDPNFAIFDERDFAKLLPEDEANVASFIATPTINFYKTRLDLAKMQFVSVKDAKNFVSFSHVLEAARGTPIDLPGRDIRIFSQVVDVRARGNPRLVVVDDEAFNTVRFGCDEFLGALVLRSRSGKHFSLILDGLRFGLMGDGPRAQPVIEEDVRKPPQSDDLPLLTDSIEFSLAFAEGALGDAADVSPLQDFARRYLLWLSRALKPAAGNANKDVLALRVRALDLAKFVTDPKAGAFVPVLPYKDYEEHVDRIGSYLGIIQKKIQEHELRLEMQRQKELDDATADAINQNIINTGKLIVGIAEANAELQKDLEGFYDTLVNRQRAEIAQQKEALVRLKKELRDDKIEVRNCVEAYKRAFNNWHRDKVIEFGLDIASKIFELGVAIAIPGGQIGAVEKLGKAVENIQKMLEVFDALSSICDSLNSDTESLTNAQNSLDKLDSAKFGAGANIKWDMLPIDFGEVMDKGPAIGEKVSLKAAVDRLVLRGKAVTETEATLHGLQREVYTYGLQKELNQKHGERLKALKDKLNPVEVNKPDRANIDLMALTGPLVHARNRMLTILARSFLKLDQALRYAYLQPATSLISFSLMDVRRALVEQKGMTIAAKELLSPIGAGVSEVNFTFAIDDPRKLTDGRSQRFIIYTDEPKLARYVTIEVQKVVASFEGVKATASGQYLLQLAFPGDSFENRDIRHTLRQFRTARRTRVYEYDAVTGTPLFLDEGASWSENVSPVTPFGAWEISFPKFKENEGLTFGEGPLLLRLKFILRARIVSPALAQRLWSLESLDQQVAALAEIPQDFKEAPNDTGDDVRASRPSESELVTTMAGRSCTNGWDVVFNMELDKINQSLADQWQKLGPAVLEQDFECEIFAGEFPHPDYDDIMMKQWKRIRCKFTAPKLKFEGNANSAATPLTLILDLPIPSGDITAGTQLPDKPIRWKAPTPITNRLLKANGAAMAIAAQIESGKKLTVRIELAAGLFTTANIGIEGGQSDDFNKELKAYFAQNNVKLVINELDISSIPHLPAMRPSSFVFRFIQTPSGAGLLQLFIRTNDNQYPGATQANLQLMSEPLPQDYSASLIINSRLLFEQVLPKSLSNPGWSLRGEAIPSGVGSEHWSWKAVCQSGNVFATIDLRGLTRWDLNESDRYKVEYTYELRGGNPLACSMSGLPLEPNKDGQLKGSFINKNFEVEVTERWQRWSTSLYNHPMGSGVNPNPIKTSVSLSMSTALKAKIGGSGRDQTILFDTTPGDVRIDGRLSGGGNCGSDDLQAKINQELQKQIPRQIVDKVSFDFKAVSVFALKNILFYEGRNYINLESAYIPGDLVLFGNFQRSSS